MDSIKTRHISNEEYFRTADFLIVFPRKTETVTKIWHYFPKGYSRDFSFSKFENVERLEIEVSGQVPWEYNVLGTHKADLPFWRGLDIYEKNLSFYSPASLHITPRDPEKPFSVDFSYTSVYPVSDCRNLRYRLSYVSPLMDKKRSWVRDGTMCFLGEHMRPGQDTHNIQSREGEYLPVTEYSYRIESLYSDVKSIQEDEKLKKLGTITDFVSPNLFVIIVSSEKREEFKKYFSSNYWCGFSENSILIQDEAKTKLLKQEELQAFQKSWNKILASSDNIPFEIDLKTFVALPEESEFMKVFTDYVSTSEYDPALNDVLTAISECHGKNN